MAATLNGVLDMRSMCLLVAAVLSAQPVFAGDTRDWGQRLADTTIAEHPDAWSLRKSDGAYRWAYTLGLVTLGMERLHRKHGEPRYRAYMKAYVDHYVGADGSIRTLALDEFDIDSINSGKLLFPLLQETGDARYRAAIEVLHRQLQWRLTFRHPAWAHWVGANRSA